MRSRSKNYGGVFLVSRKAVLGVILLLAIPYALAGTGGSESTVAGIGNPKAMPSTAKLLSETVNSADGSKVKKDGSRHATLWRTVRMRVTAYCPCRKCCGRHSDGITACGHKIRRGDTFVAADRKHAFGTKMIVPGYNNSDPVKVLDRGRAIRGNRLDVFFNSHRKAKRWGVKYLLVKVCTD
jgi:3D (Asp-Asp-Asp) domain-containing protein